MNEMLKICEEMCDLKRTLEKLDLTDAARGIDAALYYIGLAIGEEVTRVCD